MQYEYIREYLISGSNNPSDSTGYGTDDTLSITNTRANSPGETQTGGSVHAKATAVSVIHHRGWSYIVAGKIRTGEGSHIAADIWI